MSNEKTKDQIDLENKIAKLEAEKKALNNQLKAMKEQSGDKIKFKDNDGKEVVTHGVLYYYYSKPDGKYGLKKATLCTKI